MPCTAATAAIAACSGGAARSQMSKPKRRAKEQLDLEDDAREAEEDRRLSARLGRGYEGLSSRDDDGSTALANVPGGSDADADNNSTDESDNKNPLVRAFLALLEVLNNVYLQFLMYIAYVTVFFLLTNTMRAPQEYFFDKMIADTFVENSFDAALNTFSEIRRVSDIYEWGNRGEHARAYTWPSTRAHTHETGFARAARSRDLGVWLLCLH